MQVAPFGVHRLDAAAGVGLVDDVVVVQRTEMDELAGDATAHHVVGCCATTDLRGGDGDDGTQPFAPGDHEMRGDLREIRVGRWTASSIASSMRPVIIHRGQRQQRRPLGGVGHAAKAIRGAPDVRRAAGHSTSDRPSWLEMVDRAARLTVEAPDSTQGSQGVSMSLTRSRRRSARPAPVLALPLVGFAFDESVAASALPTTPDDSAPTASIPDGYVRLVDDTAFLTVVVPETWDVVTRPGGLGRRPATADLRLDRRSGGLQHDVRVRRAVLQVPVPSRSGGGDRCELGCVPAAS